MNKILQPDYVFETSWEICNMVGGIHTVLSTKARTLKEKLGDRLIMIGPEVWKETSEHPNFREEPYLYRNWSEQAKRDGLNFRIGRWKIEGEPVVILVDFTPYFSQKDEIFKEYWERYRLDSLQGGWDYAEPSMFGYAAARIIEHFYEYNVTARDRLVAHFHEWMTGLGLLYLKANVPQVACVFTTHATMLGRTLAGNGQPLYRELENFDPEVMARQYGIPSKFSMESLSAKHADAFTTVSNITAKECNAFYRGVDVVTPNGFEDAFVPDEKQLKAKSELSRKMLSDLAEALTGTRPDDNSLFVSTSGRYEFANKGIDVFIEALEKLKQEKPNRQIWNFILVPAGQSGPKKELAKRLQNNEKPDEPDVVTHQLMDSDNDPVINHLKHMELNNQPDSGIFVVFIPAYLNGSDGLLNISYYDLLPAFDLTVYASYYEPWGYTPLESIAFRVPTVTTTLTGMGQWVKDAYPEQSPGVEVIHRDDDNRDQVVDDLAEAIRKYAGYEADKLNELKNKAWETSRIALWKNLISNYYRAWDIALQKSTERFEYYKFKQIPEITATFSATEATQSRWKKILIEPKIPENLQPLVELSKNLWWTWDHHAKLLFASVMDELWRKFNYNPIHMIEALTYEQLKELSADQDFLKRMNKVYGRFREYMDAGKNRQSTAIAYFSMEYGLHDTLKTYSGGLGMLAGDYLKEASDSNVNMVSVGLLYRYGYFKQEINIHGQQEARYIPQKFTHLPLKPVRNEQGNWVKVKLALPGRNLMAKVWRLDVGRVPLYLLDADIEENTPHDRFTTHQLYGGDIENRFKQELLLGIGGMRMLSQLNINPGIFHINEGHAAFMGLERLRILIQEEHLSFYQALEVVRAASLFTTHTPVPAGHDVFDENVMRTYIPHYASRLNISWDTFMDMGRMNPGDRNEKFSMSVLAINLSQEVNGVSRLHAKVSRDMFSKLYPGYLSKEIHIKYVTNGVHYSNWTSGCMRALYEKYFGENWEQEMDKAEIWEKIREVPDGELWHTREHLRENLVNYLNRRVGDDMLRRQERPRNIRRLQQQLSADKLTIGFARRFATYKRAGLLFSDLNRLSRIVNNPEKPVQFIFAGKAHPNDGAGQELLKNIFSISHRDEFLGKIIFVEDYDIALGRKLVQGVDLWLNTPTRPLEASGTSGQKATLNGVLNCSVLDGWWAEGYQENAGWALPENKTYDDQHIQDELDAETLYDLIESEIIDVFYDRNSEGIPEGWVSHMKNAIAEIAPRFTTRRMLNEYNSSFYQPLINSTNDLLDNDYRPARDFAAWKQKVFGSWDMLSVKEYRLPDPEKGMLMLGEDFVAEIDLDLSGLEPDDVGLEIIFGNKVDDQVKDYIHVEDMEMISTDNSTATFRCEIHATRAGVYDYAFRLYPKHPMLKYRQLFPLVKWL